MTRRTLTAGFVLAVTLVVVAPLPVFAQERSEGAIQAWHPVLAASVERLAAESPSWREAMKAGQSALTSCAIQRENVIRREMRLGPRSEYGRDSLAIARRSRQ